MTALLDPLALAVSAAGLVALCVAGLHGGRWRAGVQMALTLWTAAGLLRLAGVPSWDRLAASAALVAVRHVVVLGLGSHARGLRAGTAGADRARRG